ncbi:MAG: hypothetical protein U0792_12585 [Gemmataceae bacterium]
MSEQAETPTPPPVRRFRLDAVALTLFAVGGLLTAVVTSYGPLSGSENVLGSTGDQAAAMLVDVLGWGVVVFLVGWFVLAGLFVVNRSPLRLTVRLLGWSTLTACAAAGADWFGEGLAHASASGRGGSVGAYLRFGLEDNVPDTLSAQLALGGAVLVGLLLAADFLVLGVLRTVWAIVSGLWKAARWGNNRVADGSQKVLAGIEAVAKVAKPAKVPALIPAAVPAPSAVPTPAAATAKQPPVTAPAPPTPEPTKIEEIPIHIHTEPAAPAPAPRRCRFASAASATRADARCCCTNPDSAVCRCPSRLRRRRMCCRRFRC